MVQLFLRMAIFERARHFCGFFSLVFILDSSNLHSGEIVVYQRRKSFRNQTRCRNPALNFALAQVIMAVFILLPLDCSKSAQNSSTLSIDAAYQIYALSQSCRETMARRPMVIVALGLWCFANFALCVGRFGIFIKFAFNFTFA